MSKFAYLKIVNEFFAYEAFHLVDFWHAKFSLLTLQI